MITIGSLGFFLLIFVDVEDKKGVHFAESFEALGEFGGEFGKNEFLLHFILLGI